ncbi:hypothetical protein OGAPHI_006797 [Ogataea philodendri]|uniref:Uncharacterized protein n=1 Tax=Ogataea philodendri TaxID=1378263 RepID=A0A9P8NXM9_9ASCO|nr:uncharacterized protein OGAPHI_006797 [Ogataea philodendri]KAH3661390.1 hypothetical protein OGAPHI_006797 [Ogataea philodendri]
MSVQELRQKGNEKFHSSNYPGALILYTECINLDPQAFAIYCNRAATLIKLDCMKEAEEDLVKSLQINPEYVPSLCRLGFLYLYEGNTVKSLENYVKAVQVCAKEPHQLDRFKGRLKEAVRLAEGRAKQQGYSQEYIDTLIPATVRATLDNYRGLASEGEGQTTVAPRPTAQGAEPSQGRPRAFATAITGTPASLASLFGQAQGPARTGTTSVTFDTRPQPRDEPAQADRMDEDPEVELRDVDATHRQIHERVQNFMRQQQGQPVQPITFARNLASTITSQFQSQPAGGNLAEQIARGISTFMGQTQEDQAQPAQQAQQAQQPQLSDNLHGMGDVPEDLD